MSAAVNTSSTLQPCSDCQSPADDSRRTARTVALLVLVGGLVSAVLLPPGLAPDEGLHFFRAYDLSEGRLWPTEKCPDAGNPACTWGGASLPVSLRRISAVHRTNQDSVSGGRITAGEIAANFCVPLDPDQRTPTSFAYCNSYSFVPYLPQAAGIFLARLFGGGPLLLFYAGRLANLSFAILLVYWSVRLMPVGRMVLGAIALIPITVHQFASMSGDTSAIGSAFLLTALLMRLALDPQFVVRPAVILMLGVLAAWIPLCKLPYATLFLLYFAIPPQRFGSLRRYLALGGMLLAVVLAANLYPTWLRHEFCAKQYVLLPGTRVISVDDQIAVVRNSPVHFLGLCLSATARHYDHWLYGLGVLGLFNAPLGKQVVFGFLGLIMLLGLVDRPAGLVVSARVKVLVLLSLSSCVGLILLAHYVIWNAVGASDIDGMQGRYLVPILPAAFLLAQNRFCHIPTDTRWLGACWLGACVGVQAGSVVALLKRYYWHHGGGHLSLFIPLVTAAAVGLVAAKFRWRVLSNAHHTLANTEPKHLPNSLSPA